MVPIMALMFINMRKINRNSQKFSKKNTDLMESDLTEKAPIRKYASHKCHYMNHLYLFINIIIL